MTFSTLIFVGISNIAFYNKVFDVAQNFLNLKVVMGKTSLIFNHVLDN
jgi:hypothetical protein